MRTFLLSIFWISNVGGAIQLLIIASASWVIFSGTYSFTELNVDVFITQLVPWLLWLKTLIVTLFGELGRWDSLSRICHASCTLYHICFCNSCARYLAAS